MARELIIDLGMHRGQDTHFYLKKGFRVVAVEANPCLVERGRKQFHPWIRRGRLEILECAVAEEAGVADFFLNDTDDAWSSLMQDVGSRGERYRKVSVETRPLGAIIAEYGMPYYLKIDIEGKDLAALKALRGFDQRPRYVSVENGFTVLQDLLRDLGYSRFKWINQAEVPRQKLPFPPREGGFCLHRFQIGSSGAFGEETPGDWMSLEDVRAQVERHWARPGLDADVHGWFDLHAAR